MATTTRSFIVGTGPAQGEMALSDDQLRQVETSCTKAALSKLTPDQRQQLRQAVSLLRNQVSVSQDRLGARLARINAQIGVLQGELDGVQADAKAFSNYYRQMAPAIASCPEASEATAVIHGAIQPVTTQAVELGYQMRLAKTQLFRVQERLQRNQTALNYLDRVTVAIS